jgi:hypothetical protein
MITLCMLPVIFALQGPAPAAPVTPTSLAVPATPATATATATIPAESPGRTTGSPPPVLGPKFDAIWSDRINRNLRGVGIGFDQGLWGHAMGQSLKLSIPFGKRIGQFFGVRLRGFMVHDVWNGTPDGAFGGGLELFGRSPVFLGLLRIYGGGGLWAGGRPFRPMGDTTSVWAIGGGGHFGLEVVLQPRLTISFEVGAQSGLHARRIDVGPSVMAGFMFWLGNLRARG